MDRGAWGGHSPWGHKESDMIEHVHAWTSVQKWIGGILVDMETAVRATRVVLIRDVGALGQADPLEEGMATHSSIFAWRISWTEEPGRLQSTGSQE